MKPEISIIGTGSLGTTLARALHKKGYSIKSLFNRTVSEAKILAGEIATEFVTSFPGSTDQMGDLLFITVSDEAIPNLVSKLSNSFSDFSGKTVVHCSGNETSLILEPLKKAGASTASFHPLQTFHNKSGTDSFKGIYISLEGDDPAVNLLSKITERLGAKTLSITPEAKPYLHAAAVMVSNYLVTLMNVSGKISELGGIPSPKARQALIPLVKTSLENTTAPDLSAVLSGPIARGDARTVKKHLNLLEHNKELLALYKSLGLQTLKLAEKNKDLPKDKSEELRNLLK